MPARQRGSIGRKNGAWQVRWYEPPGNRTSRAGFRTKTEAAAWLEKKLQEVEILRTGDSPAIERPRTLDDFVDMFLERWGQTVEANTCRTRACQLKHARKWFGERRPESLARLELEDWRAQLPPGSRQIVFAAFRSALKWGVDRQLLIRNPTDGIRNPHRKKHERRPILPFEDWSEVEAVSIELHPRFAAIPIFVAGTGLRPSEWIALDRRRDIDWDNEVVHVRRRFIDGQLKEGGKTRGSTRDVPLRTRVLEALDAHPTRDDTSLLFPAARGGYIRYGTFKQKIWKQALRAAGLQHRGPYSLRHTFASWALDSGEQPWYVAEMMGTSEAMLRETYFHFLRRTPGQLRARMNEYDARPEAKEL